MTKVKMTDQEVLDALGKETKLNKIRRILYHSSAKIEQACAQRKPPGVIEMRRMEFEAAQEILDVMEE